MTLRHLTVFLPSRNKRRRQILCWFSLTKSTHKKSVVGAYLSQERWGEDSYSSSTPQISCTHLSWARMGRSDLHTPCGTERYPHLRMLSSLGSRTGCSLQPRAGWELTEAGFRWDNCCPCAGVTEPVSIRDNSDTNWCGTRDGLRYHEPLAGVQSCGLAFPFLQQQQQQQQINTG